MYAELIDTYIETEKKEKKVSKYIKVIVKNYYLLLATQSHINLKNVTKIS